MNTRIAKKVLCYPLDPKQPGGGDSPYTRSKRAEAARVYLRCLGRERANRRHKWCPLRPTVWQRKWTPGRMGAAAYAKAAT